MKTNPLFHRMLAALIRLPQLVATQAKNGVGREGWNRGAFRWMMPLVIPGCLLNSLMADQFGQFTYTDDGTSITITGYQLTAVGSVEIPESITGKPVTSIGNMAFFECRSLTAITVDPLNESYSSTAGVLFNKSRTHILQYPQGKAGGYSVPHSVTAIER